MHVTQDTPDCLVLESRPWVLGSVLIICILLLLALALGLYRESVWLTLGFALGAALLAVCFVAFVRRELVMFDRKSGALVIRSRSLMGQEERTLSLTDVTGAEVEILRSSSTGNNGNRTTSVTHRTVLKTRSGPLPLSSVYSSGSSAEVNAAAINRWLTRSET